MKRLTYKNYIEEYEVNFEKSSDKNWSIAESDTHIKVTGEPVNKLGELEDVLESWHIENLEELKTRLHDCQAYHLENNSNETLIHNLKNELAELKQKAIMPKFKIGQEIWETTPLMSWKIKRIEWHKFNGGNGDVVVEIYRLGHDMTDDYNCCIMPADNDRFFATKEEAEQKLREFQGEKKE